MFQMHNPDITVINAKSANDERQFVILGTLRGQWATWIANDFHAPGGPLACYSGHYYATEAEARDGYARRK